MILQGQGLTVRYPRADPLALDDVSCAAQMGQLHAVVGPNGSGKTTLLRALLGLVPCQRGDVTVDGRPLASWAPRALAQVVGVVPQREETVFPLSVLETVLLGRYPHLGALAAEGPADRAAVQEALTRCDAWDLRGRAVDTLSGGEWQRVRVARALAQEPRILVLDEPTASLDVRHEMEVFELVRGLVDRGLAGLVITHQLNLAARYADTMTLLDRGRMAATGTPAEVLRQEVVTQVFRWPVAVTTWHDGSPQVVPLRPDELDARGTH